MGKGKFILSEIKSKLKILLIEMWFEMALAMFKN